MKKQTVLVTGGTSGIGRGITERFLSDGHTVYALGRTPKHADELRHAAGNTDRLHILMGDLCDHDFRKQSADTIANTSGGLNTLINCAGIVTPDTAGIAESLESWRRTFDVNLFALIGMTQGALPLLRKASTACIINISSVYSINAFASDLASYSASKAAVDHITRCWAKQLAPEKIRVNAINPGGIPTNIGREFPPSGESESDDEGDAHRHILGRLGMPSDIAKAAAFLASDEAEWITGIIMPVDGGYSVS